MQPLLVLPKSGSGFRRGLDQQGGQLLKNSVPALMVVLAAPPRLFERVGLLSKVPTDIVNQPVWFLRNILVSPENRFFVPVFCRVLLKREFSQRWLAGNIENVECARQTGFDGETRRKLIHFPELLLLLIPRPVFLIRGFCALHFYRCFQCFSFSYRNAPDAFVFVASIR